MKLFADLVNMDVSIEEEDKTVILLNSIPDEEYESFVLILINSKQTLNYSDVSITLVNYEVRRKDKLSFSNGTTVKAMTARGIGPIHRMGKGEF